jgi:hypothetical protein
MARDSYRKALTSYGPHTADYMVTELVALAGTLKGGPAVPANLLDPLAAVDEARQAALAAAIGRASSAALDQWQAALPDDLGSPAPLAEPADITRFAAASFSWRGGSSAVDNPIVRVERLTSGHWVTYGDQTGEVPTMVELPSGAQGTVDAWTAAHEWRWTASFEAFDAFPRRVVEGGQVPTGTYRFVVDGEERSDGQTRPYHLESATFQVTRWDGVTAGNAHVEPGGAVSFTASSTYPRTYDSPFPYVHDDGGTVLCRTCSFRPWASSADVVKAVATVSGPNGTRRIAAVRQGDRWRADVHLAPGERVELPAGSLTDAFGETNGTAITLLEP